MNFSTPVPAASLGMADWSIGPSDRSNAYVESRTFGTLSGVTHIRFSNLSNHGDTSYFAMTEICFGGTAVSTNSAPTWTADPVNEIDATEDAPYASTLADNASDAEDTLTFAKVNGPAWLTVSADGALSGTPANADVGVNVFTVSADDGTNPAVEATLNITVINTNDAPVFTADPINGSDASEDVAYSGTLTGSASDDDAGASLSYAKVAGPAWLSVATDGTLSGTPTNSDVGANAFTVSVTDGVIAVPVEATLNITVINTNDAPAWISNPVDESAATEDLPYSSTLADDASDVDDGASLTYAKLSGPAWLSVAVNGALSGTPSNADVGANAFTVSVTDGIIATPVEATLNITVINTNDAPAFTSDPINGSDATEDAAYSGTIAGTTFDDDGDAPIYSKTGGPAWLSVAADGTLSGTPANADVGLNVFTVSVTDGNGGSDTATLNVTVINTNDAPVFTADPFGSSDATEDAAYSGTIAGSATDDDADAALTYAKVSGPAWLSVAADGTLSGTPANADVGANSFIVSVTDGIIATPVQATLNITVLNTNDAPVFATDPIAGSDATEDLAYSGTIADSATDDDGDTLAYAKVSGPAWLAVAADGTLSGIPTNADVGANAFTVSVTDGVIATPMEATLNITVNAAGESIVITPISATSTTTIGSPRTIDKVIDGSGLTDVSDPLSELDDYHPYQSDAYWLSGSGAPSGGTEELTFELGGAYDVDRVHYWLYTRDGDRNLKTFDISYSTDGGMNFSTPV
ncbi:putative Ig domain-containing protein, partial [Haloferula sp. A504]|uniref:putative Ig domain-containing protein n=1 Tax=Haloferula sp. A504 TaxID=3373601 RepID=UPI0031BBF0E9|nr:putative Ig domain-containing protein [Verrucomicrobiaceae bacterium E54]